MDHKDRHSRGYLPHCDFAGSVQAITFRLSDSIPKSLLESWRALASDHGTSAKARLELLRRIAEYEDAGRGSCVLRATEIGAIVQEELISRHGQTHRLIEWCVMPNHVHVLIGILDQRPLGSIVQQWKGASALRINRMLGRSGRLWMKDYFDRFIRDQDHFENARLYIRRNPVKAVLCREPEEWPLSSVGVGWKP